VPPGKRAQLRREHALALLGLLQEVERLEARLLRVRRAVHYKGRSAFLPRRCSS
jgi:hypothetical protein